MKCSMLKTIALGTLACCYATVAVATTVDFELFSVADDPSAYPLAAESNYNGFDSQPYQAGVHEVNDAEDHPFVAGGVTLEVTHEVGAFQGWPYTSWEGWAVSNRTDAASPGDFSNAFNSAAGGGLGGSENYAVAYLGAYATNQYRRIDALESAYFTNTTWAATSMLSGDQFAKRFGYQDNQGDPVSDGSWPDWFLLTITGIDAGGDPIAANPVEFYLADYRFGDNGLDYIVTDWIEVDLSSLSDADELEFTLTSSDPDAWGGYNTPLYFAMDGLQVGAGVPEPTSVALAILGVSLLLFGCRRRCRGA